MRSSHKTLVAALAGFLLVPQLAAADQVEEQLKQMQERMSQMEDQLTATNDQLENANKRVTQQESLIERAGLEDERGSASGLSAFLEQTEFNLSIAASHFWNFNDPSSSETRGANVGNVNANPFHPNTSSFQVDEVWFSMAKAATAESRAGFGIDLVFGQTADALNGDGFDDGNGDSTLLYQGYLSYMAPILDGVEIKAGRWETITGAEVARATENFNITRGLVYSALQPINHVGVIASSSYDSGWQWAVGVANDSGYGDVAGLGGTVPSLNNDDNYNKAVLGRIGYSTDEMGMTVNVVYGGNNPYLTGAGRDSQDTGIVDVVLNWDPTDDFSGWLNVDYVWLDNPIDGFSGNDPWALGIAAAGRMALTDRTGFSIRGEYIRGNGGLLLGPSGVGVTTGSENIWTVTGTLDHALTDQLTLKTEVRYEQGKKGGQPDSYYNDNDGTFADSQVLIGGQLVYNF